MAASGQPRRHVALVETGYEWFHRLLALYCLLSGLLYWMQLIGFRPDPVGRFDLMPSYWQAAAVSLAVLYPLAASGLWMLASWGPVIWLLCAAIETTMYAGLPALFGARPAIIATHGACLLLFVVFRALMFWDRWRTRDD